MTYPYIRTAIIPPRRPDFSKVNDVVVIEMVQALLDDMTSGIGVGKPGHDDQGMFWSIHMKFRIKEGHMIMTIDGTESPQQQE